MMITGLHTFPRMTPSTEKTNMGHGVKRYCILVGVVLAGCSLAMVWGITPSTPTLSGVTVLEEPLTSSMHTLDASFSSVTEKFVFYVEDTEYYPPLSLSDAYNLIEYCMSLIDSLILHKSKYTKRYILTFVDSVIIFLKRYEETKSSPAHYKWQSIDTRKVNVIKPIDDDQFRLKKPLKNVQAISFTASGRDVLLYTIVILPQEGESVTFEFEGGRKLIAGMPMREIFFLPERMKITQVIAYYSTINPDAITRVTAYAGITKKPEYGKQALFHLNEARELIDKNSYDQAKEPLSRAGELFQKISSPPKR